MIKLIADRNIVSADCLEICLRRYKENKIYFVPLSSARICTNAQDRWRLVG